jgi:hypothetical protein
MALLPTRLSRRAVTAALLTAALFPLSAGAHPPPGGSSPHGYSVHLEDGTGIPLPTYWHRGERFVLGRYGDRYAVRLENHTNRRVEAVLSVDGRDAVSGQRGAYERQRGYLIEPHGAVVVTGFRRSLDEVATFRFTSPGDSYSSRMGTPENVGIVGVAFFPEAPRYRDRPLPLAEKKRQSAPKNPNPRAGSPADSRESKGGSAPGRAAPAPSAASGARDARAPRSFAPDGESGRAERDNLGTEYGERRDSRVTEVPFRRSDPRRPAALVTLRYDDAAGLEARGIRIGPEPRPWWARGSTPQAFPDSRFAPPPP